MELTHIIGNGSLLGFTRTDGSIFPVLFENESFHANELKCYKLTKTQNKNVTINCEETRGISATEEGGEERGSLYNYIPNVRFNDRNFDLLVCNLNNFYKLYILEDEKKLRELPIKFQGPPMIITNHITGNHFLLGSPQKETNPTGNLYHQSIYKYEIILKKKKIEFKTSKILENVIIRGVNSSSLVDLTGDLQPELVLDCFEIKQGQPFLERKLKVYPFEILFEDYTSGRKPIFEEHLGKGTKSVLFVPRASDLFAYNILVLMESSSGIQIYEFENTVALIDKENDYSTLNSSLKSLSKFEDSDNSQTLKFNKTLAFHINNAKFSQFYCADITADGGYNLFIVTASGDVVMFERSKSDNGEIKWKEVDNEKSDIKKALKNKKVERLAVEQIYKDSNQQLIFQAYENANRKVFIFDILKPDINNKNNLSVLFGRDLYNCNHVPGATIIVGISNGTIVRRISQLINTTQPMLTSFNPAYLGVGNTHFFLTYIITKLPGAKGVQSIKAYIFPSTSAYFVFSCSTKPPLSYVFFQSPYFLIVIMVLFAMSLIFTAVLVHLSRLEAQQELENEESKSLTKLL